MINHPPLTPYDTHVIRPIVYKSWRIVDQCVAMCQYCEYNPATQFHLDYKTVFICRICEEKFIHQLIRQRHAQFDISGETVVITGRLQKPRSVVFDLIQRAGGVAVKTITKDCTLLIQADGAREGNKYRRAIEYGIRIMPESQLWKVLGIEPHVRPIKRRGLQKKKKKNYEWSSTGEKIPIGGIEEAKKRSNIFLAEMARKLGGSK